MDTKLTLKLNKEVIEKAKQYAQSHERSLSGIIESYLEALTIMEEPENGKNGFEISPFVKSISSGVQIPVELDYKSEYSNYLTGKYK
ncbi:MAG: DUF6364 family protein [Mariniphaga sp.]